MKNKYLPALVFGVILLFYIISSYGVSPYFSIMKTSMFSITGGDPSQPIDHPTFNPGNITFSKVFIPRGAPSYYDYYYIADSGDLHQWFNDRKDANAYLLVAEVLTKPDGSKEVVQWKVINKRDFNARKWDINENGYSGGCKPYAYSGSYSQYVSVTCILQDAVLPAKTVYLNESGRYQLDVITMPLSKIEAESITDPLADIKVIKPISSQYTKYHYRNYADNYQINQIYCYNNKKGYSFDIVKVEKKGYGDQQVSCGDLPELKELCWHEPNKWAWYGSSDERWYYRCVLFKQEDAVKNLLVNGTVEQSFKFEVKADIEKLEEQLAELRNIYSVQIDELLTQLNDENLTADQFEDLMNQYRELLENKTDARLVEKLTLLRYDFEYKLKKFEEQQDEKYDELKQMWGETIPLLQLDIAAIKEQLASLENERQSLEQKIAQLEAEGNNTEAEMLKLKSSILAYKISEGKQAIVNIEANSIPFYVKVLTVINLALLAYGAYPLLKKKLKFKRKRR